MRVIPRGVVRVAIVVWFFLIAASAVLTFQHHLLDVVGGFALAGYCFYFIREKTIAWPVVAGGRIGLRYAIGALLLLVGAIALWPWGAMLLWPMMSLALVASAYFGDRSARFSQDGWCTAVEHRVGARARARRPTFVASLLPASNAAPGMR